MFDGVPFGSSGRIVGHGDRQVEAVGQLGLKLGFPGVTAIAVAAAGIGQNEELARAGITVGAFLLPPVSDGMSGKGGRVVGNAHDEGPAIFGDVENSIGNGDADGVGAKVVIEDAARAAFPTAAWITEIADQFALLGIDTDDRQMMTLKPAAQFGQVFELEIAIRAGVSGDLLVIHAQRIAHLVEQASDGIGTDSDAELAKFLGYSDGSAASPAQTRHGIAGGVVFQQAV